MFANELRASCSRGGLSERGDPLIKAKGMPRFVSMSAISNVTPSVTFTSKNTTSKSAANARDVAPHFAPQLGPPPAFRRSVPLNS